MEHVVDYLALALVLHVVVYAAYTYLDFRQLKAVNRRSPPPELAHLYKSSAEYEATRAYGADRARFGLWKSAWDAALSALFLCSAMLPLTWEASGWVLAALPRATRLLSSPLALEAAQSALWLAMVSGVGLILDLPWSAVRTFGLEARHGFNQTSARTFALDALKSAALGAALLPPLGAGLSAILARSGPHLALQLWAFLSALSLALMWAHPALIAPMFNTFSPLPEGSLRARIEALAADVRFPLKKLFVVDGSARSAHSNAYMFGFGRNKRVVLYDTLLQQCSEDQILAVLAHELGHWKLRHTVVLFLMAQLQLGGALLLFTALRTLPGLTESFGFGLGGGDGGLMRFGFDSKLHAWLRARDSLPLESWRMPPAHVPALAALLLLPQLMGPLDAALGCLSRLLSRAFEYQADAFAADRGLAKDLQAALITLDRENKSAPHSDALYSAVHHSHPTLLQRLRALEARAKKRL